MQTVYRTTTLALVLVVFASLVEAETGLNIDVVAGSAFVEESGYDTGNSIDIALSYSRFGFNYRVGGLNIGNIGTESDVNNAEIEITGIYFSLSREFEFQVLKAELGAGLLSSESQVNFLGRRVAEEEDTSPFVSAKLLTPIGGSFLLEADWKYINDLSGSNFNLVQAGIRFSF